MSRNLPKNLGVFTKNQLEQFFQSFDTVLTDCDGVLWLYNNVIEGSNTAINRLIEMGKKVYFITNNSTKTRDELAEKARVMDFNVGFDNMISTAYLAAQYLKKKNFDKKVFLVGSAGIAQELDMAGIAHTSYGPDVMEGSLMTLIKEKFQPDPEIGAVVVGFDEHISFPKMLKAASYLENNSNLFLATNTDERFPMPGFVVPGTGSIVRAIETCGERKAKVMGKPETHLCKIFFSEEQLAKPDRFLMIGDRLNTDILFGKKNNFQTLLVETGVHKMAKVNEIIEQLEKGMTAKEMEQQIPDYYISALGDLFKNYD